MGGFSLIHGFILSLPTTMILFLATLSLFFFFFFMKPKPSASSRLPPSPGPSLPFIGHLHYLLRLPLHRSLSRLAVSHSPVLLLRLGSRSALLVSSASAADECFTKNDFTFANRPMLPSSRRLSYNFTTLVAAPYGSHWRNLRRLIAVEAFSSARLNSSPVVNEEVRALLRDLAGGGSNFRKVEVRSQLEDLAFNVVMRMTVGKKYFGGREEIATGDEGRRFQRVVKEGFELAKESSVGDFLPILQWIGGRRMEERMERLEREADGLFQVVVEERRKERRRRVMSSAAGAGEMESGVDRRTIVDRLLELQEVDGECYTDEIIKGVILTMIAAGTDTVSQTMEWAMALLLNHPQVLEKATAEIDEHVGHQRVLEESDLPRLPYLNAVLRETLRLYPAAPLLLPHESSGDSTVGGFFVPAGTIIFVNAYHIQRDPEVWPEPASFRPERFGGGEKKMATMAFGMGRRCCPGEGLAMRVVGAAVGGMVQCLEWRREGEGEVDMEEGAGMTMPKKKPLLAVCGARSAMADALSKL
ncbi:Cytochrome P450 81D1 [Apostasia shenzhenica]|uniref:Cytochrome P450 81D1 n=1 Tax=Apostasia shenzhenica TaxID=1088818 RepID=A0A2I0A2K3_9ASPA|nr:Cytochrome P450 81D1 [Apostasia shenzhenica]